MTQLAISFVDRVHAARRLGAEAGEACADKAETTTPEFRERALDFIVNFVRQEGQATGENATRAAVLAGIKPHDERAFGPVYLTAIRRGLIRVVGYAPRVRGHGSAGGKVYAPGAAL